MPRVIIQPSHHSSQLWDFCYCCTQRVKGSKRFSNAFWQSLSSTFTSKKNTNHQTWFKIFQILFSILRVCPYFCSPLYVPATRFSNPRGIKAVLKLQKNHLHSAIFSQIFIFTQRQGSWEGTRTAKKWGFKKIDWILCPDWREYKIRGWEALKSWGKWRSGRAEGKK